MNTDNIKFGKLIKEKRLKYGWSRKKLGEIVGLHESTIQRYEEGKIKKVSTNIIKTFFKALNIEIEKNDFGILNSWNFLTNSLNVLDFEYTDKKMLEILISNISKFMTKFNYALTEVDSENNITVMEISERVKIKNTYPAFVIVLAFILRKNINSFTFEDIDNFYSFFKKRQVKISLLDNEFGKILVPFILFMMKVKNIDKEQFLNYSKIIENIFEEYFK